MSKEVVIVSFARTPIGSFQGALSSVSAPKLGAVAIKEAVSRAGINPSDVDEVIMGNVLPAGEGQAPARQASIYAGLPHTVECMTINKVCGSGLKAVMLAEQTIKAGDADIIVAGGMENMSQVPYYLPDARTGMRMGNKQAIDGMVFDGLWDPYNNVHMGSCAENLSKEDNYTREEQDEFAIESYKRSLASIENGLFKDEIVPVEVPQRRGGTSIVDTDEEPGKGRIDKMSKLRPAFDKEGTITAANASSINDGAAVVVVMSKEKADALGLKPIAKIVAQASAAQEPIYFTTAPVKAMKKAMKKANLDVSDIDLFEINEAFSNVTLAAMREFNINRDKVNVNGGAVSLGHPIGASGARIFVTLLNAMNQQNAKRGLATLCIGGGEASAIIVESL
ncbi:MAG: acetyl-CoA C-acetyltransferase [Candidatus Marinimicrobia bacterium]|nr:acetyl-CoA C-acetyltransferase [Candidatus Neomarinimicrobiota bacterium]MBL7022792.1 acetyl-CoA C-acetyltransferase [Candidatus Neomarinimicrobiota bacterium]MBL7109359.1 acetyl-CoA C-acetyltransferase [Candidatus Neomarinimicrobiota bacterium]